MKKNKKIISLILCFMLLINSFNIYGAESFGNSIVDNNVLSNMVESMESKVNLEDYIYENIDMEVSIDFKTEEEIIQEIKVLEEKRDTDLLEKVLLAKNEKESNEVLKSSLSSPSPDALSTDVIKEPLTPEVFIGRLKEIYGDELENLYNIPDFEGSISYSPSYQENVQKYEESVQPYEEKLHFGEDGVNPATGNFSKK